MKLTTNQWNKHVASIWADIFSEFSIEKHAASILEIAPGGTPKIALALKQIGWKGNMYIVEPELKAAADTVKVYQDILDITPTVLLSLDFWQTREIKIDLAVGNHILDDIILSKSLKTFGKFHDVFNDHYSKPVHVTVDAWLPLMVDDKKLFQAKQNTWSDLYELKHASVQLMILSQYSSYFFTQTGFTYPDKIAQGLLREMIDGSNNNEWIEHPLITEPKTWGIFRLKA